MLQPNSALPDRFRDVEHLEEIMTAPTPPVTAEFGKLPGDLIILGVGGKIGPTLAHPCAARGGCGLGCNSPRSFA
jgi:hypothetical protein